MLRRMPPHHMEQVHPRLERTHHASCGLAEHPIGDMIKQMLIRKSGDDPHQFLDVMTNSLFAAPAYRRYGELIVEQKFQSAGFRMPLALKDIRSLLAAAEANAVPMPVGRLLRDHFISRGSRRDRRRRSPDALGAAVRRMRDPVVHGFRLGAEAPDAANGAVSGGPVAACRAG